MSMPLGDYPLYVTIPASDLRRARRFYEETLGFKNPEERDDGIRYTSGSSKFLLYESQFAGTNQATLAAWDVEDLDRVVAELREAGVTFEQYDFPGLKTDENGIAPIGNLRGAWFKDTEGNILSVGDH
jgi:catechol 2,3-dioxygenase-like lactoylglutathione lyase family enzyme